MENNVHTANKQAQPERNAILVNKELVGKLRSALRINKSPLDKLASNRDIISNVLLQMRGVPNVYSKVQPKEVYKFFDSEIAREIQSDDSIVDKGRYVDAMIIAYLYGPEGIGRYCVGSRVIRPSKLDPGKLARIRSKAAEIAAVESVDSAFVPGTEVLSVETEAH